MMDWKAEKRACDKAAREHAEGGEDQTVLYAKRGMIDRYRKVYAEARAEIEATAARDAEYSFWFLVERELDVLSSSDNEEIRALTDVVARLAQHMKEKDID